MIDHVNALKQRLDAALSAIGQAAEESRRVVDGEIEALHQLEPVATRPPLIADVPVDEPPPYVPPPSAPSVHALIPDTPLVDGAGAIPAFDDDAPLWQN